MRNREVSLLETKEMTSPLRPVAHLRNREVSLSEKGKDLSTATSSATYLICIIQRFSRAFFEERKGGWDDVTRRHVTGGCVTQATKYQRANNPNEGITKQKE